MKKIAYLLLFLFFGIFVHAQPAKREIRGTWIATVEGIDWPQTVGTNAEKQQQEMVALLDHVRRNNLNTIAFQIRPTADAFYDSAHEPWSHWLTGTPGTAPGYDPLQFVIDECGKRGIAVHVWINPYRVWLNDDNLSPEYRNTLYRRYPGWLIRYGKTHYFHPADDRSREHILRVAADIVSRYDIDAIHMDDYFYPYRIAGQEFPDEAYFKKDPRGFKNKEDWRRDNVDRTIRALQDTIKSIKPWVEFGISPFGVWRNASKDPRGSATRAGQTNYDDLYADILKWEQQGWIDYVAPQIYWEIGHKQADFATLARWWDDNAHGTPVYVGQALYRVDPRSSTAAWRTPKEIVRQIELNRTLSRIQGSFLYSAKFLADPVLQQALAEVYPARSLWPENPRIEPIEPFPPGNPVLTNEGSCLRLSWQPETDDRRFVVYRIAADGDPDFNDSRNIVCVTTESSVELPAEPQAGARYFVSALSLTHRESEPIEARPWKKEEF
jgi:uncharacterized lipoprotein YddW (UPF0748 family)